MPELQKRVAVVDDEAFFRDAIAQVLEAEDCGYVTCEDGEEALEVVGDEDIGVVLVDIRMPGLDGIETLRRIREVRPELPVIMLSAAADQDRVLEALRLGACDYLAKPIHDEELLLSVKRALHGHRIAENWGLLRERLEALVNRVQDLTRSAAASEPSERMQLLRQGAVEAAADILEAEKASVMLLTEEGTELEVVAAVGRDMKPGEMDRVAVGSGVAGRAVENREPLLVDDVASDERFEGDERPTRYDSNSFALAPLESGLRSFGVLCVTDRVGRGGFSEDDLSLLRMLALHVSELMDLDTAAGEDRDSDLDPDEQSFDADGQTRELGPEAFADEFGDGMDDAELARIVCDAIVSEVEPQRLLDAVLRQLATAMDAAPVSILLVDGSTGALALEGEWDGGVRAERRKLERGQGLTGAVLQTGSLVASGDPASDPRFDPEVDTPADGEVAPLLCVPLRLRGKVLGVFRAFLAPGETPSARTGELLSAAISAAVRNVLLYRSLVDSIAEVAEARRAATGVRGG